MTRAIIWILLVIGLASSCFVAGQRLRVEYSNRAVEVVVDYDEMESLASATGADIGYVLSKLASVGVTGVAVSEQTLGDAIDSRTVVPYGPRSFAVEAEEGRRIANHLRMALPAQSGWIVSTDVALEESGARNMSYLTILGKAPMSYLERIPVGLPNSAMHNVRAAGLDPVARLTNYPGAEASAIGRLVEDAGKRGVRRVVFQADQVLGFRGAVKDTALAFIRNGMYYGRVEFAKQKGDQELAEEAPSCVLIVHSISSSEMPTIDQPTIIERFQKAVRERDVRMCYVRIYNTASPDLLRDNLDYIRRINQAIVSAGYGMKTARPFEEMAVPTAARCVAGLGVAAGAIMLLLALFDLSAAACAVWLIIAAVVCAGLPAVGAIGQKTVALLAALIFPTLAAILATRGCPEKPTSAGRPFAKALGRYAGAVGLAAAGGALVVGLVSERAFMLRIDQFMGVKAAHLLPVVVLALLYAGAVAWKSDLWGNQKRRFARSLGNIAVDPILAWQAAALLFGVAVVFMMVARSGNDSGVQVSGLEIKFRAILDRLLFVRPRTKEFLIGYPALICGIAFALRGQRRWAAPLVVFGSIGLVSTLNTFCHIHTPLTISLVRALNGAVLGALVGGVAYWLIRFLPGREK